MKLDQAKAIRWKLTYKKVPAPATTDIIEASSEALAVRIGEKWCALNNARYIGVKPEILADERLLNISTEPEVEPLPDAIEATTAQNE